MSNPRVLWIDPGIHNGWCIMEFGGNLVGKGIVHIDDLSNFLAGLSRDSLHIVGVENFRIYRRLATQQAGSSVEAAQSIGIVRHFASVEGLRFVEQEPVARKSGAKFVGYKLGKGHTPDDISAWLHCVAFLTKIGKFTTALERKLQDGR